MAGQAKAGKGFEYALLYTSYQILSNHHSASIIQNSSYMVAQNYFNSCSPTEKNNYLCAADKAINHIIILEPRLTNPIDKADTLTLQLQSDNLGIKGDVRDVLFIKSSQSWEIGISAKNNHKAIKHSRLSPTIDFAKKWFGLNCSNKYWSAVKPIFGQLKIHQNNSVSWNSLQNKNQAIYLPLLIAFKDEVLLQHTNNPGKVPTLLLKYLLGIKDYYKVIKESRNVTIIGFN